MSSSTMGRPYAALPRRGSDERHALRHAAKRAALRARALAASSSRFLGGAAVTSCSSSRRVAAATVSTASSNAAALACEGLVAPLILRTYCSAASWTSASVAGGGEVWRGGGFGAKPPRDWVCGERVGGRVWGCAGGP